jgi:CMP-N-acetylneuraminic acid synthetase
VLSTEDAEIAAFGEEQGAAVVSRPAHLAGDDSETIDAVVHALSCVEDTGAPFDQVVVLQPTSPFRTADDIDAALSLLGDSGADSVVSVYEVGDVHPARMYRLEGERLEPYASEASTLRQRLPVLFHRNGAIYACRRSLVAESRSLIGADTRPLVMPRDRSVNIDDEFDLRVADLLLSHEP